MLNISQKSQLILCPDEKVYQLEESLNVTGHLAPVTTHLRMSTRHEDVINLIYRFFN